VTRRGGASRAASTARARASTKGATGRARARWRPEPRHRASARRARARRRHSRCLLRRRAATGVPRFRKRARSRSRGAVPSQRAVQVDANAADETFARPKPRVPTRNAPPRRRARRVLEPAYRVWRLVADAESRHRSGGTRAAAGAASEKPLARARGVSTYQSGTTAGSCVSGEGVWCGKVIAAATRRDALSFSE
jgi:hypothetical protein